MKNLVLNVLAVAVLAVMISACGGGKEKLLETVTQDGHVIKYEYDNKNRISKITYYEYDEPYRTKTLFYNGNDLVKEVHEEHSEYDEFTVTNEFVKSGNTITISSNNSIHGTMDLDRDGYPIKLTYPNSIVANSYVIKNGNLIQFDSGEQKYSYEYDDKKSPLSKCKTPKWYLFDDLRVFASANNPTKEIYQMGNIKFEREYKNEYDDDDFVIKQIKYEGRKEEVTTFKYYQ